MIFFDLQVKKGSVDSYSRQWGHSKCYSKVLHIAISELKFKLTGQSLFINIVDCEADWYQK